MAKQENIKKSTPAWMATFADLSTLLLTFFVLMLSMANIDIQKFRDMLGSVQTAFGVTFEVKGDYQAVITKAPTESAKDQTPPSNNPLQSLTSKGKSEAEAAKTQIESAKVAQSINKMIAQKALGKSVKVMKGKRGVRLRVKGGLLFTPGKATLKKSATPLLQGLVKVLKKGSFYLVVEGHTDNLPIKTANFPSNWELAAARATAVVRYLADSGGVDPKKLSAVGFGPNYPVAPNDSPQGRRSNRRVEFIFTKVSPRVAVR